MKQIFITQESRFSEWSKTTKLLIAVFFPVLIVSVFAVGGFFALQLLGVFILSLAYLLIVSIPGRLELEDGILSRRNFIKYWSIPVSSITDIIQGVSYGLYVGRWRFDYSQGLSFKTKEGKFYEFPSDVQDTLVQNGSDLISLLKEINPAIEFHFDAAPFRSRFGWKGDKRIRRRRRVLILCIAVLFAVGILMHYLSFI